MRIALARNGVVFNVIEAASLEDADALFPDDEVFASDTASPGWVWNGDKWEAPPPPPEPQPTPASPFLYAAAQFHVQDGDVSGIGINSRFAGAFWLDVGKYYVFFAEPQPDTNYIALASAGHCPAYVLEADKTTDSFVITVTDPAGAALDAEVVSVSIVRAG